MLVVSLSKAYGRKSNNILWVVYGECVCGPVFFCLCLTLGLSEKKEIDLLFYISTCCFASCGQIGVLSKM